MSNGKSNLPNGGYTLTHGSNYMMDGFQFDTEYGGGPQEKARLPEAKGLSALPSGMIPEGDPISSGLPDGIEADTAMDLDDLYKEGSQTLSIVDHSWLASQPQEDLSGMMEMQELVNALEHGEANSPESEAMLTLGQAWGEERTDGLNIMPNQGRAVKPKAIKQGPMSTLPQDLVKKAYRKLSYGESIDTAMDELDALDSNEKMGVFARLKDEYGLAGRVYVRERDFPGIFNGRWDEVINRRCATSLYIVADHADNVHDRFLGRKVVASVSEIDWKHVSKTLCPKLDAYGVKLAGHLDYRERVRKAFTDLMEGRVQTLESSQPWYQIQEDPSDLISLDRARRELADSPLEEFHINTVEDVRIERLAKRLERVSKDLIREGFLEEEQVEAVVKSANMDTQAKIDRLYALSVTPKQSSAYRGRGLEETYHTPTKSAQEMNYRSREEITLEKRIATAQQKVSELVSAGLISLEEAQDVSSKFKTPEKKMQAIMNRVASKGYDVSVYQGPIDNGDSRLSVSQLKSIQDKFARQSADRSVKAYQSRVSGEINRVIKAGLISSERVQQIIDEQSTLEARLAHIVKEISSRPVQVAQDNTLHVLGQKKASVRVSTEQKVASWLRQKMSEGMAGKDLDTLINARFSSEVLSHYESQIKSMRLAHEGLSGHAYVDAEVYMTEGMEGCDKGALVHRANQIPAVLKTARCGGCVFNSQGTCQKYAKTIIASASDIVENAPKYQKEMIRLANADDAERTASLFVNEYDQDEFNLVADGVVEIEETEPSHENLGDVLFGGFEV